MTIQSASINAQQKISWLVCSISLNNIVDYSGKLVGLMGNNNGDPNDDVISRNGIKPTNMSSERAVYQVANTCQFKNFFVNI